MALKKDFNWTQCGDKGHGRTYNSNTDGDYHRIKVSYHYTHEHPQYLCFDCNARFTPLEQVDKGESCIKKVIRFFRWRTI